MKAGKLLLILFIASTLTLGLSMSQSVFGSDKGGPPGSPHTVSPPPVNPQDDPTGDPHHGASPPPGYGDPHTDPTVRGGGTPHLGDKKGNPHEFSPLPGHAKGSPPSNPGEAASSASHGEPTFDVFPGEPVAKDFPGEPVVGNEFPGEPFSNVSFGEATV
ncbi:MAG: exported protein of unknown function [Nitrosopumilales archaeon]|nr:MAG: exported protein of unknown function [Nitrosopumilales archaeon]